MEPEGEENVKGYVQTLVTKYNGIIPRYQVSVSDNGYQFMQVIHTVIKEDAQAIYNAFLNIGYKKYVSPLDVK